MREMNKAKTNRLTFYHKNMLRTFRTRRHNSCLSGSVPSFYRGGIAGSVELKFPVPTTD